MDAIAEQLTDEERDREIKRGRTNRQIGVRAVNTSCYAN
jgi:hypothetical protein